MESFDISTIEDLKNFAKKIASKIKAPISIGLEGELGAGKTTFVTELCRQLGSQDNVSSPTYILQNEYQAGDLIIEHWDLYRAKTIPEEILLAVPANHIRIIEWSNLIPAEHKTDLTFYFVLEPRRIVSWG